MIITVAHQKGGVGKTTLAINITASLEKAGNIAALVDADAQGSATALMANFDGAVGWKGVKVLPPPKNFKQLLSLPYTAIVVDTPPYISQQLPAIFDVSDFILVPCKDSTFDAMAIGGTLELVKEAQQRNPELKCGIVLNMVKGKTAFTRQVVELLKEHGVPIMRARVQDRVIYKSAPMYHGIVHNSDDHKARIEMLDLSEEITEMLARQHTSQPF